MSQIMEFKLRSRLPTLSRLESRSCYLSCTIPFWNTFSRLQVLVWIQGSQSTIQLPPRDQRTTICLQERSGLNKAWPSLTDSSGSLGWLPLPPLHSARPPLLLVLVNMYLSCVPSWDFITKDPCHFSPLFLLAPIFWKWLLTELQFLTVHQFSHILATRNLYNRQPRLQICLRYQNYCWTDTTSGQSKEAF